MSRSPLKRKDTAFMHPDPAVSSTLQSIRQNPKFSKLLGFSMTALGDLLRKINPKHRNNAKFIIDENGHKNLVQALIDHNKVDAIICASSNCLIKIISSDKYYEEEFCKKIAEEGIVKAIHTILRNGIEKTSESYLILLALIRVLANSRVVVPDLIEGGIMSDLINLAQDSKLNQSICRESLDVVLKLANTTRGKTEIAKPEFIASILEIFERRLGSEEVIEGGMKILDAICNTKEGLLALKENPNLMKVLVPVLQKHPHAKFISESAVRILPKLSKIEDIEKAFNAVKSGDVTQIPLLASLLLVDDFLTYILQKGAIQELISLLKSQENLKSDEQLDLVRSISIALGRICVADDKNVHEIIKLGGLEVLSKYMSVDNVDVIIALMDTVKRLAINEECVKNIIDTNCLEKIMNKVDLFILNQNFAEGLTSLLATLCTFENGKKFLSQTSLVLKLFNLMKNFVENKRIQEQSAKTIAIIIDEESSHVLVKADLLNHLSTINNKHPDWPRFSLYGIKLLDVVTRFSSILEILNKDLLLSMVVDILTKQIQVEEILENKDSQAGNFLEDLKEISENKSNEQLNSKQEKELRISSVNILEKIIDVKQVEALRLKFEQLQQDYIKKGDQNTIKNLVFQMKILTTVIMIPSVTKVIIEGKLDLKVLELTKKIFSQNDLEGSLGLLQSFAVFFGNIGHITQNKEVLEIIRQNEVHKSAIETLTYCLDKNSEEIVVETALKSLQSIIQGQIIVHDDQFDSKKEGSFLSQNLSTQGLLDSTISNLKKFTSSLNIPIISFKVLNSAANLGNEYLMILSRISAPNVAASLLENEYISSELSREILLFLSFFMNNDEFINFFLNTDGLNSLLALQSKFKNIKEISDLLSPFVQKLSELSAKEKIKRAENLISEYLETLEKYQINKASKHNLAEALVGLLEMSLIGEGLGFIEAKNGFKVIASTFIKESAKDIDAIKDQGDVEFHESTLEDLILLVSRLFISSVQKNTILIEYIDESFVSSLISVLGVRIEFSVLVKAVLNLLNLYLSNQNLKESAISQYLNKDIITTLFSLLEFHKEDIELTNSALQILMVLAKESKSVTTKLGNKSFIRSLIKKTRNLIRQHEEYPSGIVEADQNLKCLLAIASEQINATSVLGEGGLDLCCLAINYKAKHIHDLEAIPIGELNLNVPSENKQGGSVSDSLANMAVSLLKKLTSNSETAERYIDTNEFKNILKLLDDLSNDQRTLNILEFLEITSESNLIGTFLGENSCVDRLMRISNLNPTNKELLKIIGNIIKNLGGNMLISDIVAQIESFHEGVITKDPESVVAYQGATLYLANLYTAKFDPETEAGSTTEFISILEKCLDLSVSDQQLLGTQLIVIERILYRDISTKAILQSSSIPAKIVSTVFDSIKVTSENVILIGILFDILGNLIDEQNENLRILDGKTGEEVIKSREQNNFAKSIFQNGEKSLTFFIEVLRKFENKPTILENALFEKSLGILSYLSYYEQTFTPIFNTINSKFYLTDILASSSLKDYSISQEKILVILDNVSASKLGYEMIISANVLKKLSTIIQDTPLEALRDKKSLALNILKKILEIFRNLSNNDLDHGSILDCNIIKSIIYIFECLRDISTKDLPHLDYVSDILSHCFDCLQKMSMDPILLRALLKMGSSEFGFLFLNKISDAIALNPHEEINPDELSDLENMKSSLNSLDRAAESVLGYFVELAKNSKYAKDIPIVNQESTIYQDLLNFPSSRADSPIISFRVLLFFHGYLVSIGKDAIIENNELLSPIGDVSDTMSQIYPKIAIINDLSKELKTLLSPTATEEKIEVAITQVDIVEELKNNFEKLVDYLEEVFSKIVGKNAETKDIENADKILEFILAIESDEAGTEKFTKLDQLGLIHILCKSSNITDFDEVVSLKSLKILNKYAEKQKYIDKISEYPNFFENSLSNLVAYEIKTPNSKDNFHQGIFLLNKILGKISSDSNLELPTIFESILLLIDKHQNDDIAVLNYLQITTNLISLRENFINLLSKSEALKTLIEAASIGNEDLEKFRTYADFINKTTINDNIRQIYCNQKVIIKLLKANQLYALDEKLNLDSLSAYSKLVVNNIQNSEQFLNSDGLKYSEKIATDNSPEATIFMLTSIFLNISRVKGGKELLSSHDHFRIFEIIFKNSLKSDESKVLSNLYKIFSNLAVIEKNITSIIESPIYTQIPEIFKSRSSISEIPRIILNLLINLCSSQDTNQSSRIIKSEQFSIFNNYFMLNDRKAEETILFVELLGNFTNKKETIIEIINIGSISTHLALLKGFEFNADIVYKCLKNLFNISTIEEGLNALQLSPNIYAALSNILKIHKKANHIVSTIFKLFNRFLSSQELIKTIFQTDFLDISISLMQENAYQLQTIIGFFKILLKFSVDDECCEFISEKGAVILINSIQQNIQNEKFVKMGTGLIASLLAVENSVYPILNNKGGELIADALKYYPNIDTIIMNSCSCLSSLILHTFEVPFKLKELEFPKLLAKVYSLEENKEKANIKEEVYMTALYFYGTSKEKVEEKPVPPQRKSVLIDPFKVQLMNGMIVKMWKKDGSKKEMHFYASQELDELLAKKPLSTQPEPEYRLKIIDIAGMYKGYDNDSPFAKPKGWMKKKPNKANCITIVGKAGCNTLYIECGMESECEKWLEYLSTIKDQQSTA